MKNLSLILAILFLAFIVEAQNVERSERSKERKTAKSSVSKSKDRSSKTKVAKSTKTSRTSASRLSKSSQRVSKDRKTKNSSNSSAIRSSDSRRNRSTRNQTATTTRASRDSKSTGFSRKVKTESANRSTRNSASLVSTARKNSDSRSVGSRNYIPKTAARYNAARKVYSRNKIRVNRIVSAALHTYSTLEYRRLHKPYRKPLLSTIFWNAKMYRNYRLWYPDFNLWYYPYGYRIHTVSAYDSYRYIGEVARIYGRVSEVWYSYETKEYYLYIGGSFPYHDFTVVLKARDARRYSWDPERFFTNRRLVVTGLVSLFEEKPEMFIRKRSQINIY